MEINTILFLILVAFGAMIQTITGFALALVIVAGVTVLGLAEISHTAAVVSFIAFVNAVLALRKTWRKINLEMLRWLLAGLVPFSIIGVWLLDRLTDGYYDYIRMLLGIFIIVSGLSQMVTPVTTRKGSPQTTTIIGSLGGLFGGLYGSGGAPMAWFLYRQPMELVVVRATLLAVFVVSTSLRTIAAGVAGHVDKQVMLTVGISIPITILMTVLTSRYLHLIPDQWVRRCVLILLILSGIFLVVSN